MSRTVFYGPAAFIGTRLQFAEVRDRTAFVSDNATSRSPPAEGHETMTDGIGNYRTIAWTDNVPDGEERDSR